jgi:hypothetical protein
LGLALCVTLFAATTVVLSNRDADGPMIAMLISPLAVICWWLLCRKLMSRSLPNIATLFAIVPLCFLTFRMVDSLQGAK